MNGRQIRTTIDILIPSPAHQTQQRLNKQAVKAIQRLAKRSCQQYKVGMSCYALYCGPKRDKDPSWVPAIVIKVCGPRCVAVRVYPKGPIWRRHVDQHRPRNGSVEDNEPGDTASGTRQSYSTVFEELQDSETSEKGTVAQQQCVKNDQGQSSRMKRPNPRMTTGDEYGPDRPRRSERLKNQKRYVYYLKGIHLGYWGGVM